jgi:hypothetical protein
MKHSPPTMKFEALVDTGASKCIFHASVGRAIGLRIENGEPDQGAGVSGKPMTIYVHNLSLHVPGGRIFKISAGFTDEQWLAFLVEMASLKTVRCCSIPLRDLKLKVSTQRKNFRLSH